MSSCMHIDTEELNKKIKEATIRKKSLFFQSQIKKTEKKNECMEVKSERNKQITSFEIGDKG